LEDLKQLSPGERVQFENVLGQLFVKYDVAIYFYQNKMVGELAISPYNRFILLLLKSPGVAEWWDVAQNFYSDQMRTFLNEKISAFESQKISPPIETK
jgi:hypothetical protein